ncbi:MAG: hypothetical protein HQK83_02950 [Fibrobacteria bacterium]|nr:hypothetical protein [Fibrobacteria bacterium]
MKKLICLFILLLIGCGTDNFPTDFTNPSDDELDAIISPNMSSQSVNTLINDSVVLTFDTLYVDTNSTPRIYFTGKLTNTSKTTIMDSYVYINIVVYSDTSKTLQIYSNNFYTRLIDFKPNINILISDSWSVSEIHNYPNYVIDGPRKTLK